MIVEAALAALGVIAATDLGLTIHKKRPVVVEQKSFICPYCKNDVTGIRELDIINHVTCIDDAKIRQAHEEALAVEATKQAEIRAQAAKEAEDRHTLERMQKEEIKAKEREAERIKQEAFDRENANKYTVAVRKLSNSVHSPRHGTWCYFSWTVSKGGQVVDSGVAPDAARAKQDAGSAIAGHKQGKIPFGENVTTYTVS